MIYFHHIVVIIIAVFSSFLIINTQSREYHHLPLGPNMIGPESIAFDCKGEGPYAGISDGRVMKWQGAIQEWAEFAVTSPYRSRYCDGLDNSIMEQYCGRPLGIKFDMRTCELYIADSSLGLMKVGSEGGVATSLSRGVAGVPFRFLNALDIDSQTGAVYFTDTSSNYHRWEYAKAIASFDHTGKLLKYDPRTKVVTVLLDGLFFANGVALSEKKDFVLVAETTAFQIRRLWLTGPQAGISEIFIKLTGLPDNINRNNKGEFWVAQNPAKPVKLDQSGKIMESLDTPMIVDSSDIIEFHNSIWIGSLIQRYLLYSRIG
ncbi:protein STRICTOSIDINE SYNTHASE-LIKE 10-like [Silene latifolia]|uniref:protein STRICTOSIDINE SYNTHASE-LIKE 10-like n=1 Tax=Silene latifolia TaxID=37657 RepID=UPI003D783B4E